MAPRASPDNCEAWAETAADKIKTETKAGIASFMVFLNNFFLQERAVTIGEEPSRPTKAACNAHSFLIILPSTQLDTHYRIESLTLSPATPAGFPADAPGFWQRDRTELIDASTPRPARRPHLESAQSLRLPLEPSCAAAPAAKPCRTPAI